LLVLLDDVEFGWMSTLLMGRLTDQAALHGVLAALYELGMPLLSVECAGAS
jgi:hypothetical protein